MTPNDEGNEGPEEPGEGEVTYMGVILKEGRGPVFVSSSLSGERGDGVSGQTGELGLRNALHYSVSRGVIQRK